MPGLNKTGFYCMPCCS